MADDPLRVAIVEDDPATGAGLTALFEATPGLVAAAVFRTMEEALAGLDGVDVVLLDLGLPGTAGIDGLRRLRACRPELPILVLTIYSDHDHVFAAIRAGACGYLLKDTPPARLVEAVREVATGGAPLSPAVAHKVIEVFRRGARPTAAARRLTRREQQVLDLLADGHSYKTAADALGVSRDTIRFHIRHLYDKLHVHSKSEAVGKALRLGLIR